MTESEAQALVDSYCQALATADPEKIGAFWRRDQSLLYIAEEIAEPMIGWDAVAAYWRANGGAMSKLGVRPGAVRLNALAEGVVAVLYPMHWDAQIGPQCLGGDVQVSLIVASDAEGWRIVHYTESALGPLPFLRRIYREAVTPGFGEAG